MAAEKKPGPATIDEYIAAVLPAVQPVLQSLREAIREEAPAAAEKISWQMPTFYLNGNLIHFAAHKNHVGLYPGAEAMEAFSAELAAYKTSKGAVQFPYTKPLPLALVRRIVRWQVEKAMQNPPAR